MGDGAGRSAWLVWLAWLVRLVLWLVWLERQFSNSLAEGSVAKDSQREAGYGTFQLVPLPVCLTSVSPVCCSLEMPSSLSLQL